MSFTGDWNCECKVCDQSRRIAMSISFDVLVTLLAMSDGELTLNFVKLQNLGVSTDHLRVLLTEAIRMQHTILLGA